MSRLGKDINDTDTEHIANRTNNINIKYTTYRTINNIDIEPMTDGANDNTDEERNTD